MAQTPATSPTESILMWAGILMVLSTVLIVAGWLVYRHYGRSGSFHQQETGFSLEDLRILHQQGQLSDDEFNLAKEKLMARFPTDSPPPPGPDNPRGAR